MAIDGYTSTTSVRTGSTIAFHLSAAPAGATRLEFWRVGFGRMPDTVDVTLTTQAMPAEPWLGYRWPASVSFRVPAAWPSGLYRLRARGPGDTGFADVAEFAVRIAMPGTTARVLLVVDFIREQAYNGEGGRSFYSSPRAPKVSFNRKQAPFSAARGMQGLIEWLNAERFAVEVASTVDLHALPSLLDSYDCLLMGFHAEYWSREMRTAVERFVARGGNLVSLSGNTCYRQVRFEDGSRTLVCYKNAAADPHAELSETTVAFAQPPVNRPPNSLLGVGFNYGAWGGSARAYTVHFPGHWVLAGVPLPMPAFMTYETDAAPFVLEEEGYPRVTTDEGTPLSTTVLASAEMHDWNKPGLATMTLTVRHGAVFSAGTTEWISNLHQPSIAGITRNVLNRLRSRLAFGWVEVGHANNITAMTAWENKLYAADAARVLWSRHPVLADARWRNIGHANDVIAMAADRGALYAVSRDNTLWWRWPRDADYRWAPMGAGAPGGTRALCASGGTLYAVATNGTLHSRPATRDAAPGWRPVSSWRGSLPATPTITALAAHHGVLYAATNTHRLLRTDFDFVEESISWIDLHACNGARALAAVDGMLFMAGSDNRLRWLDLRHRDLDALSTG